jgi:hypothetical protein
LGVASVWMNIGFSLAGQRVQGPGDARIIADKWRLRPKGSTAAGAGKADIPRLTFQG